jgi:hypothetical protein
MLPVGPPAAPVPREGAAAALPGGNMWGICIPDNGWHDGAGKVVMRGAAACPVNHRTRVTNKKPSTAKEY